MSNITKPVMLDDTGKSVAQALGNVATAINNLEKVQWGQVKGTLSNQTDLNNNLNSLQSQIDSFTALTPGSTTGDAELTNIRVDSAGHTYNTAGDAVRAIDAQVNAMKTGFDGVVYPSPAAMVTGEDEKLQNQIDEVKDGLDDLSYIDISPNVLNPDDYGTAGIIINSQGKEVESEHENWCESGYIPFTSDMVMRVTKKDFSQYYAGQLYDSNKNFLHRAAVTDMTTYFELRAASYPATAYIRVAVDTSVEFMAVIDQAYPDTYTPYYDPTLSIRPTVNLQLTKRLHTYGVKWAVAGDSWSAENDVLHKYHYYISQELGLSVINTARSGTGWKKKADENRAFCDRVNSIPLDAGLVTILGSGNDCQAVHNGELGTPSDQWDSTLDPLTNNTICAYINHTLDLINARVPLAKLGVIAPGPWSGYPTYVADNDMEQLVQALKSICLLRGIPFLDLYHSSGLRPWDANQNSLFVENDASTNTHPNDAGQLFMSPVIREFIKSLLW